MCTRAVYMFCLSPVHACTCTAVLHTCTAVHSVHVHVHQIKPCFMFGYAYDAFLRNGN